MASAHSRFALRYLLLFETLVFKAALAHKLAPMFTVIMLTQAHELDILQYILDTA